MKSSLPYFLASAALALTPAIVLTPAGAEPNGRPPVIKLGQPSPTPSPSPAPPITIGKAPDATVLAALEENKVIDAVLKLPLQPQAFQWSLGQPPQQLPQAATHICVLSGVAGDFGGGGELVQLTLNMAAPGGARYVLSGSSGHAAMRANAICVKKDRFTPGMLDAKNVTLASQQIKTNTTCNNARFAIEAAGPEHTHFIRAITGAFDGANEQVQTMTYPASGSTFIKACSGFVGGAAAAIHMIGSGQIKYIGPNGKTTVARDATFNAWSEKFPNWQKAQPPNTWVSGAYYLAPVDQALCGIVTISGRMKSAGEGAEIVLVNRNGVYWWAAQVSNANVGIVAMSARCIARDQRA